MRFFYSLILLSCIFVKYSIANNNNNNYIPCTSRCSPVKISFAEPSTFPIECQSNDYSAHIYENALLCTIEYRIDYRTRTIEVKFEATNDTTMINNKYSGEYLIQEIRLNITQYSKPYYTTFRRYGCTTNKDCAREFYLSTITKLLNGSRAELNTIKKKLNTAAPLFTIDAQRRCIDSDKTGTVKSEKCRRGTCYVHNENYILNSELHTKSQKCEEKYDGFLFSSIEYHSPQQIGREKELLEYRCNKNVCNRDEMIHIIQGIISNYTRWSPNIVTDDAIINIKTVQNSSMSRTVSSCIVVLFLMLIELFI